MNPQTVLTIMAGTGNLEKTKSAVADGADPKSDCSLALRLAAENGHSGCVEFLIPLSGPEVVFSKALETAAMNGHVECVRLLIPVSDPKSDGSAALEKAAGNWRSECISLLIPVSETYEVRTRLTEEGNFRAVALLDSIIQKDKLRANDAVSETKSARAGL